MTIELRRWTDDELRDFVSAEMVRAVDARGKPLSVPVWLLDPSKAHIPWEHTMGSTNSDDRLPVVRAWSECLEHPGEVIETLTRARRGESWYWLRARRLNLLHHDRVGMILICGSDEGEALDVLTDETTPVEATVESPPWAIGYIDHMGIILEVEGQAEQLFGSTAAALVGKTALDLFRSDAHSDLLAMWVSMINEPGGVRTLRVPLRQGEESWVELTVINRLDERLDAVLLIVHDISEKLAQESALRESEADLRLVAERDGLTGAFNRSTLDARLDALIAGPLEDMLLIFVDLDDFKAVNDEYGHEAGDLVLRTIAQRLEAAVRPSDLVARYGGDEFVVVCPGVGAPAAPIVLARIDDLLGEPIIWTDGKWSPSASMGIAHRRAGDTAADLLRRADEAMFEGKRRRQGSA